MKNAAESSGRGRDPLYALAMVDTSYDIPQYRAGVGKLLTLTASEAIKVGYSEGTVSSFEELLKETGYENAEVISTKETISESIARFITHPVVVPISAFNGGSWSRGRIVFTRIWCTGNDGNCFLVTVFLWSSCGRAGGI